MLEKVVEVPQIDRDKRTGCGLCVIVCTGRARAVVKGIAKIVHPEDCVWCTQCETICPSGAAGCQFEITLPVDDGG